MSHYDNCRPGYCAACGAGPGNIENVRDGAKCPSGRGDKCPHVIARRQRKLAAKLPRVKPDKATRAQLAAYKEAQKLNEKVRPPLEKKHVVFEDVAGMQAYVQYGRLHVTFKGITLQLSPQVRDRNKWQNGFFIRLANDTEGCRLIVQPEITNQLVLRREPL